MKKFLFALLGLGCILAANLRGQRIEIDWSKDDAPMTCPAATSHQKHLPVLVRNVNDILYSYTVETSSTPITSGDFENLPTVKGLDSSCSAAADIEALTEKLNQPSLNPNNGRGQVASISLRDTLGAWAEAVRLGENINLENMDPVRCGGEIQTFAKIRAAMASFRERVEKSKQKWSGDVALDVGATNRVSVTITERYGPSDGGPADPVVTHGPITRQCDISSSVLDVGAETFFSSIGTRNYTVARTPTPHVPGAYRAIVVQGSNSRGPFVPRLLSYAPALWPGWPHGFDFQISTGLMLRTERLGSLRSIGSSAEACINAGNYFPFTPGINFGKFADFPSGFSSNANAPSTVWQLSHFPRWGPTMGDSPEQDRQGHFSGLHQEFSPTAAANGNAVHF
ncbi:MAG TPA: hypothetical protein VHZ55_09830 [Bryobacteraceae bacterium]|jgi:hypothetical protein|nr:hypothetical protein [Bryobacteraceae bacterium]